MTMSPEKRADEEARKLIKDEIFENFFVEAGAGSGKTTALVNRMVNMVKSGISVDKICAITFTKAAANEFYARFKIELIREAQNGDAKCKDALTNIDLCFMGTIDSFCHMILNEHPREAGIPSDSQILDDDMKEIYYRHVYSDIQKGAYGDDLKDLCIRFRDLNGRKSEKIFIKLIQIMMERRNAQFDVPEVQDDSIDLLFAEEKTMLQSVYHALKAHPDMAYTQSAAAIKSWDKFIGGKEVILGEWDENIAGLLSIVKALDNLKIAGTADISVLGRASDAYEFRDSKQTRYKSFILREEYSSGLDNRLSELKYAISMQLAIRTVDVIVDNLKQSGKLSFFDYQYYLLQMLRKDAADGGKLIRHIYERHSYFLLDEFQDTDPMQAQIFFYLTAECLNIEWDRCIPHKGSLFIVGDPKQSIYRFRNADVGAFKKVKGLFSGQVGKVINLPCNFRSTKTMCTWFNEVFSEMMPEDTSDQSKYDLIPLDDKKDIAGTFCGVYNYAPYIDDGNDIVSDDPGRIVGIIHQLVGNPEYLIQEEKEKDTTPRQIRYNDIMVITSGKTKIKNYISLFAKESIPYKVEGSAEFKNSPSLVGIFELFSAIAYPNDRNKLYVALTGKVFALSNSRLMNAADNGQPLNAFIDEESVIDSIVGNALFSIRDMYYRSTMLTPSTLFSIIMDEYRIFEKTGAENVEYTYYALELLRQGEVSGSTTTIKEGADFLSNLIEGGSGLERIMSLVQNENRVHIANLHKVKGLEAPIVILAASNKSIRVRERTDLTENPAKTWIFEIDEDNIPILSAPGYEEQKEAERGSQEAEHQRLLYVAATRARRALIIGYKTNKAGEISQNNYWYELLNESNSSFESLPCGSPAPCREKEIADAGTLLDECDTNVFDGSNSDRRTYEVKLPSKIKVKRISSSEDIYEDEDDKSVKDDAKKKDAALIGTMVHRLMELMVTSNNSLATEDLISDILSEYRADESEYTQMLKTVATVIQNGGYEQPDGSDTDILNELLSADEKHCEIPFCYEKDDCNEIWNGVMDVVYHKNGKWHIIDYKTDSEIEGIAEKHEEQLKAYISAFKILTGEDADARIYHIEV